MTNKKWLENKLDITNKDIDKIYIQLQTSDLLGTRAKKSKLKILKSQVKELQKLMGKDQRNKRDNK